MSVLGDCIVSYVYGLGGEKINIKVAYPVDGTTGGQKVILIPLGYPNNGYYKRIMQWVEEGNTIIDNPPEENNE